MNKCMKCGGEMIYNVPRLQGLGGYIHKENNSFDCPVHRPNDAGTPNSWLDKDWSCKVCGGEIPHGHSENCDYYKLWKQYDILRLAMIAFSADNNWKRNGRFDPTGSNFDGTTFAKKALEQAEKFK